MTLTKRECLVAVIDVLASNADQRELALPAELDRVVAVF